MSVSSSRIKASRAALFGVSRTATTQHSTRDAVTGLWAGWWRLDSWVLRHINGPTMSQLSLFFPALPVYRAQSILFSGLWLMIYICISLSCWGWQFLLVNRQKIRGKESHSRNIVLSVQSPLLPQWFRWLWWLVLSLLSATVFAVFVQGYRLIIAWSCEVLSGITCYCEIFFFYCYWYNSGH